MPHIVQIQGPSKCSLPSQALGLEHSREACLTPVCWKIWNCPTLCYINLRVSQRIIFKLCPISLMDMAFTPGLILFHINCTGNKLKSLAFCCRYQHHQVPAVGLGSPPALPWTPAGGAQLYACFAQQFV